MLSQVQQPSSSTRYYYRLQIVSPYDTVVDSWCIAAPLLRSLARSCWQGLRLAAAEKQRAERAESQAAELVEELSEARDEIEMLEEGMRQLAKKVTVAQLEDQHHDF